MRGLAKVAVALLAAISVSACATMSGGAYQDPNLRMVPHYKTWSWTAPDALPTGDPRLDNNVFFQDRLQGAVEKQLAARGLAHVFSDAPDLLVHVHANVSQRFDVGAGDRRYAPCTLDDCGSRVIAYEAGTLVLDVVDARTNTLIWRGWAQDSIGGILENQDRMDRYIDNAVREIMSRFPKT